MLDHSNINMEQCKLMTENNKTMYDFIYRKCSDKNKYQNIRYEVCQSIPQKMNNFHYQVISDQATSQYYNEADNKDQWNFWIARHINKKSKTRQNTFDLQVQRLMSYIPIIEPNDRWRLQWDMFMALIRCFLLVIISLESAFNNNLLYNQLLIPFFVSVALLCFDVALNSVTSYYSKGVIVDNHWDIFLHYVKNGFINDVSCIAILLGITLYELNNNPVYVSYQHQDQRIFNGLTIFISLFGILIQLQNVIRVFDKLQTSQDFSESVALMIDLAKLVLFLMLVEHMFACIWYFTAAANPDPVTWLKYYKFDALNYYEQYLVSFYFITVTMVTVGYGDIAAQNSYERLVVIVFMFISTMQLSYTISAIWTIYSKFSDRKEEMVKNMRAINLYMQNLNINQNLKSKVREYLQYYWKEQVVSDKQDVKYIIDQLPGDLQDQLLFEANAMILYGCKLFKEHFTHEFKKNCLTLIKSQTLVPHQSISFSESCLYFVERGELGIHYPMNKITLCKLKKGDNFGMREFISNRNVKLNFKSIEFSKLLYIDRGDFIKLLLNYPSDLEEFCLLQDNIIFRGSNYGNYCYSCSSILHQTHHCPLLTFTPDTHTLIKRIEYPRSQQRSKFKRSSCKQMLIRSLDPKVGKIDIIQQIPSVRSEESRQLHFNDSTKNLHNQYFDEMRDITNHQDNLKYLALEIEKFNNIEQSPDDPILYQQVKESFKIDEEQEFTLYYPQFNMSRQFNSQKRINHADYEEVWKKLSYYLLYPFMFIKKYRRWLLGSDEILSEEILPNMKKKTIVFQRRLRTIKQS